MKKVPRKKPKVSVIIAVFNGEILLPISIDSILNQTYKDFEVIIVDDGSTYKTKDVISSYLSYPHPHIHAIKHEKPMGPSIARNKAIEISKGEFIAILDHDDISYPEKLEKQVAFLDSHQDIGLVGTAVNVIDENGQFIIEHPVVETDREIQNELPRRHLFIHSSIMFRRAVIQRGGPYRKEFVLAQDYDFILRVSEHYKVWNLKEILVDWRISSRGLTNSKKHLQVKYAALAQYVCRERRKGNEEQLLYNLKRIVGCSNEKLRDSLFTSFYNHCYRLLHLSKLYYGFGCIYLYLENLQKARCLYLSSLKYNPLNIKTWFCLLLSTLPIFLLRPFKFLFSQTEQHIQKLPGNKQ